MKRWKESRVFPTVVLVFFQLTFLNAAILDQTGIILLYRDEPETEIQVNAFSPSEYVISIGNNEHEDWRITVALEAMGGTDLNCSTANHPLISLDMDYGTSKVQGCWTLNHTSTKFQNVRVQSANHRHVKITRMGNWENVSAQLVASIYYDIDDCSYCPAGTFCCEGKQTCKGSVNPEDNQILDGPIADQPRCIPLELKCNGHPNCGMTCNADESDESCTPVEDECYSHPSGCYWEAGFFWTAVLAVVFFVMAPTVVVFLICYHRQMSELNSRRRGGPVTVSSPANDLPPSYDELTDDEPPPCFCSVASVRLNNDSQDGGVDNNSFEPDARTGQQAFTCVCGGSKPSENVSRPGTNA